MNEDNEDQSGLDESATQDEADITPTVGDIESYLEDDFSIVGDRIAQLEAFQKSGDQWEDLPHDQKVVISEYLIVLRASKTLLEKFFPG